MKMVMAYICFSLTEEGRNLFECSESVKVEGSVYWRQKIPSPKPNNQPPPPPPMQQQQQHPPQQQQQQFGTTGLVFGGLQAGGGSFYQTGLQLRMIGNQQSHTFSFQPMNRITYNGIPNVPLCEVVMGTLGSSFPNPLHLPSPVFSVTVVFNTTYLLNHLILRPYPEEPSADRPHLGFSYTVEISRDGNNWMILFNYSSFFCFSTQSLVFPKQAIR